MNAQMTNHEMTIEIEELEGKIAPQSSTSFMD